MFEMYVSDVIGLTYRLWPLDCGGLYTCLTVVLLCLICVLTPSGRGIATGRLGAGPSSSGGAGC